MYSLTSSLSRLKLKVFIFSKTKQTSTLTNLNFEDFKLKHTLTWTLRKSKLKFYLKDHKSIQVTRRNIFIYQVLEVFLKMLKSIDLKICEEKSRLFKFLLFLNKLNGNSSNWLSTKRTCSLSKLTKSLKISAIKVSMYDQRRKSLYSFNWSLWINQLELSPKSLRLDTSVEFWLCSKLLKICCVWIIYAITFDLCHF